MSYAKKVILVSITMLIVHGATAPQCCVAGTVASDRASNSAYTNGWQAGDNGGSGFGPWTLAFSGDTSQLLHSPQFIDRAPLAGNSLGAPAFALSTSGRHNQFDTSETNRTFSSPLQIGHTFSIDVDGSALEASATAFTIGNTVQLYGSDGHERFGLFTNNQYNGNNWTTAAEVNTGIPAASSFQLNFKLVSANSYNLTILPVGGGTPLFTQMGAALIGTSGVSINRVTITNYGTGSSSNGTKELFFNNLMISSPGIAGDYNGNGIVDAADYVIWRKTQGRTGTGLSADGSNDNRVDEVDYTFWKTRFGSTASAAASHITAVPEPSTFTVAALLTMIATLPTKSRRSLYRA